MSTKPEKPKQDAEGQGCPEGQERNAEGKCVPKSAGKSAADATDDPEIRAILIDTINKSGYKIAEDNCDSIKSLKQLIKFINAQPPKTDSKPPLKDDSKLQPGPNTPDLSAPNKEEKTDSKENVTDLSTMKIDAKDPKWQELMSTKVDALQDKYNHYAPAPGVVIKVTDTGAIESSQGGTTQ